MSDHSVDMTGDHAVDIDKHVRVYITVFVALMVLTIVTVAVSRYHLPVPLAVTVALIVATSSAMVTAQAIGRCRYEIATVMIVRTISETNTVM